MGVVGFRILSRDSPFRCVGGAAMAYLPWRAATGAWTTEQQEDRGAGCSKTVFRQNCVKNC